jgi:hypothetical protein
VVAGVLVSGTNGITVNAPGAVVVLRGLTIDGLGTGLSGIQLVSGSALYVEDCTINDFEWGINVAPSAGQSRVFVSHTVVRNNSDDGIFFNPTGSATVSGTLDNVRTENNGDSGVEAVGSGTARVTISVESSTSANNARGIVANGSGGYTATISLSNVTVFGNTTGLSAQNGGHIYSFENNRILDNVTNGRPSRTIEQE